MAWFSGRPYEGPTTPVAVALRRSIAANHPMDISGAKRWVDDYVAGVIHASGVRESTEIRSWIEDRMRVHLSLTIGPYFEWLHRQAPLVAPGLQADYSRLMDDPIAYPTAHIVAWWWRLDPDRYRSDLEKFFEYRRQMTADTVQEIATNDGDFTSKMFNWHE